MANVYEEISKSHAQGGGKTDANLANDANHLGGVAAEQYATKKYVQDYHNTKEASQKEYIDEQDVKTLQEAKEYTNAQIRNQDFSTFAKLTDVQAVDSKLTDKIEECGQQCASNLATQIKAVVDDTNANFTDVNNAIGKLNESQNNLFQSVSDGKSKIAGAITDKGVPTSANDSYDTMADNIRSIEIGGGGEFDENFVNTADANATGADLLVGKTAYAQGKKIYGTLIAQANEGMPTYGTDTSGATATEEDIAYGKTAYANGRLLVGTLSRSSTNVEEIHGIDEGGYTQKPLVAMTKDPITGNSISSGTIVFSKDLRYCVKSEKIGDANYVASYAVDSNGLYVQQSSNLEGIVNTKKYRYTMSELGIEDDEAPIYIRLGSPGLDGSDKKCLLYIISQKIVGSTKTQHLHIYTYHLSDNGQIGALYSGENIVEIHQELPTPSNTVYEYYHVIIPFNNKYNQFYLLQSNYRNTSKEYTLKNYKIVNNVLVQIGNNATFTSSNNCRLSYLKVSNDDRYIAGQDGDYSYTIEIINNIEDTYYTPETYKIASGYGSVLVNNTNTIIRLMNIGCLYVYRDGLSTYNKINIKTPTGSSINNSVNIALTPDNKKMIILDKSPKFYVYDLEEILSTENDGSVNAIQEFETLSSLGTSHTYTFYDLFMNYDGSRILTWNNGNSSSPFLYELSAQLDTENIIGLKYKNQYFYTAKQHVLTAGQPDVRAGKTFIGWQGYIETGTMEVTE